MTFHGLTVTATHADRNIIARTLRYFRRYHKPMPNETRHHYNGVAIRTAMQQAGYPTTKEAAIAFDIAPRK